MAFVVNVSSGKGGTGKTLVSAMLADLLSKHGIRVLVIDMDIFVRGLTSLLYFERKEELNLEKDNKYSVADYLTGVALGDHHVSENNQRRSVGITRYRSFDVLPAVSRINERLSHRDLAPDDFHTATHRITTMIESVSRNFDLIFLDSRAGFDELIAATHHFSNATICVTEEDQVSKITTDNLVFQLEDSQSKRPIYRLINKARARHAADPTLLGAIPFDIDIMDSYGSESFWASISRSLIEPAIVDIWNAFCGKERLPYRIRSSRRSPVIFSEMEDRSAKLSLLNRIAFLYGILISASSVLLLAVGRDGFFEWFADPFRLAGLIGAFIGVAMSAVAVLRRP